MFILLWSAHCISQMARLVQIFVLVWMNPLPQSEQGGQVCGRPQTCSVESMFIKFQRQQCSQTTRNSTAGGGQVLKLEIFSQESSCTCCYMHVCVQQEEYVLITPHTCWFKFTAASVKHHVCLCPLLQTFWPKKDQWAISIALSCVLTQMEKTCRVFPNLTLSTFWCSDDDSVFLNLKEIWTVFLIWRHLFSPQSEKKVPPSELRWGETPPLITQDTWLQYR